jgi:hypothetical protein
MWVANNRLFSHATFGSVALATILLMQTLFTESCISTEANASNYMRWLKDERNGLSVRETGVNFRYELQFKPPELMALSEIGPKNKINQQSLDSLSRLYKGIEYYGLKIGIEKGNDVLKQDTKNVNEYFEKQNYLDFGMQHDMVLIAGPDTAFCTMYHCERNYGSAPYLYVSLGFPVKDTAYQYPRKLILLPRMDDLENPVVFEINNQQILKIPKLKI